MKIKTLAISALVIGAVVSAGDFGAKALYAQDEGSYPPIIQKLVERFGLDAGEVREVFDEARQERHQEMQARFEERLDDLVAAGDLTEEQKAAILAKKAGMQAKHEELVNLSPEERRAVIEEHREEMRTWAEENGIDLAQIGPLGGGFKGGGFGGRPGRCDW